MSSEAEAETEAARIVQQRLNASEQVRQPDEASAREAATAAHDHHDERMRDFLERLPQVVMARSFDQLAAAAGQLAVDVLNANEACVVLRYGEVATCVTRGEDSSSLATWAEAVLRSREPVEAEGERLAVALRNREGDVVGLIAVRTHAPDGHQLVRQLGAIVAICNDNLALYNIASRAIRNRDDVMAVVSHDLRAPLNNVRLGNAVLRAGPSAQVGAVLDRIEQNITFMARLADDLVDMVRIESGQLMVAVSTESVGEMMAAAASQIADHARDCNVHLGLHPCDAGLYARADRDRVLQVLSNLLSNAIKFTPDGGSVDLQASIVNGFARIEVRDTGCGIAKNETESVFLRFWQSDPKRRRGLGLGLYIVKGLVQAHGGELWFESQPDIGSRFFFTLPISVEVLREQATDAS